ncbi:MAG: efflux RND transporter periplasmic adaptor subunit [Pseudomonadota bacterium]
MPEVAKPSFLLRALRVLGRATLTLVFVGAAGAAVVLGVGVLNDRAEAVPEPEAAAPIPVETTQLQIQSGYVLPRAFMGQIEARASVDLSFELSGRLDVLAAEEGDFVEKGQVIAELDTDLLKADIDRLQAARAASVAQLEFAESRLGRAEALQKRGFTSTETLDQALALRDELINRIAETDAAIRAVDINLEKSVLYAPFEGQIAAQNVDEAETISVGQHIMRVMETSVPELRVGLPLDVSEANLKEVTVDINGVKTPATLKRLRPDVDPVTRTRTALFALDPRAPVIFGQTVSLLLETRVPAAGAWVPVDALQSGEGSVWRVLVVDNKTIRNAAVEILHIDGPRAYVRGTFDDGMQVVTAGAHRVVAGQTVSLLSAGN